MSWIRAVSRVGVVVLVLSTAACDDVIDSTKQAFEGETTTTTVPVAETRDAVVALYVCDDATSSVQDQAPGLAAAVPGAAAAALEARARTLDTAGRDGSLPGLPALQLRLSSVSSNSYLGRPLVDVLIPGVRALAPIEVDGDIEAASRQQHDVLGRANEVDAARAATADAVETLRGTVVPTAPTSDPSGCIGAAAERAVDPNTVRRTIVSVSDLEQIGPERFPASFAGIEVVPVLVCGDPKRCESAYRWLSDNVSGRGGTVAPAARPEDLVEVLARAMEVGR